MAPHQFSEAQLAVIHQLTEVLKQCQALNIHIAGITEFQANLFTDADGNDYVALS